MIVLGHSLGGNLLISAMHDELLKQVDHHRAGTISIPPDGPVKRTKADFFVPVLGNLVVLVNPAAEAKKWLDVQRAVWTRVFMSNFEGGRSRDYSEGHIFFNPKQRPTLIALTSARDWPPGGIRPMDCAVWRRALESKDANQKIFVDAVSAELKRRNRIVDYDWATFDLFPLFHFDLRPLASSLDRYAERLPQSTADGITCDLVAPSGVLATFRKYGIWHAVVHFVAEAVRNLPFMNTDLEETRTIGHVDPPRPPLGSARDFGSSGLPFGTTHEVEGWGSDAPTARRNARLATDNGSTKPPLTYDRVGGPEGQCPVARHWLSEAFHARIKEDPSAHGVYWDAAELPEKQRPALRFVHGFEIAGLAAITRPNDPFWNVRALDNALAEHDGYMLTSFICAMNQLVLDDATDIGSP